MGPTQGVHKSPIEKPIKTPDKNPVPEFPCGTYFEILEKITSRIAWNRGIRSEAPNSAITKTEKSRRVAAGTPKAFTITVKNSVKKVKLAINPSTIPKGLPFPMSLSPMVDERIIGRIGSIQGERIVTIPARNEKNIKSIIS
jgi:hypothetical protein